MSGLKRSVTAAFALALLVLQIAGTTGTARTSQVSSQDEPIERSSGVVSPAIGEAASGRELVVWAAAPEGGDRQLWGRYVDADGEPDGPEFAISRPTIDGNSVHVLSGFTVAARGKRDEFLVVWQQTIRESTTNRREIVARRYDGRGNALSDEFAVSPNGFSAAGPKVVYAAREREFFVVWTGATSQRVSVYASRIRAGASRAGAPLRISVGAAPTVAYDKKRNRYLVAWSESDLTTRTVPSRGSRLGRKRSVTKGDEAFGPDLAYDSHTGGFAVVWWAPGVEESRVLGMRLGPSGRPVATPTLIAGEGLDRDLTESASEAQVEARPKGDYMVVFSGSEAPEQGQRSVYYRAVTSAFELGPLRELATRAEDDAGDFDLVYSKAESKPRVVWTQGPSSWDDPNAPNPPPSPPPPWNVFVRSLSLNAAYR